MVNSVWKHQFLLKDLSDGLPYVSIFYGLLESGRIRLVRPDRDLMERAYTIAGRYGSAVYDTVFVALALETGMGLKTLDRRQAEMLRRLSGG